MAGNTVRTSNLIRSALTIVLLIQISLSSASTTGQANLTVGLSADNKDVYKGMAIDYSVQSNSHIQAWSAMLNYDYSDAKNRPSAINGHQYLYSSNAINAGFAHEIKTPTPFVVWNTGGDYSQSGEEDINGRRSYNWSSFTGPNFNKNIRSDVALNLSFDKGLQFVNNEYIHNISSVMQLTKRLTGMASVEFQFQQECRDYRAVLPEDTCRDSYNLVYNSTGPSTDLRISMGQTIMNNQAELLYGVGFSYQLNSSSRFSVSSERRSITIKDIVVFLDNSVISSSPETSVSTHTMSYSRQFKRISFDAGITKTTYEDREINSNTDQNINESIEEQDRSVSASYLFSNKICLGCSLEYQCRKSQQENNNWASWMLGIKYPLKQNVNGLISLRQTTQEAGESVTSINLQLNYDGRPALIGR